MTLKNPRRQFKPQGRFSILSIAGKVFISPCQNCTGVIHHADTAKLSWAVARCSSLCCYSNIKWHKSKMKQNPSSLKCALDSSWSKASYSVQLVKAKLAWLSKCNKRAICSSLIKGLQINNVSLGLKIKDLSSSLVWFHNIFSNHPASNWAWFTMFPISSSQPGCKAV